MKIIVKRNKYLSVLLSLLLILAVIFPLPALARQQGMKSKITDTNISKIENKAYAGKKQTQKPVIMEGNYKLKRNSDYTLSYKNNINIGLASVIIKGKGKYSGTATRTFQINPAKTVLIDVVIDGSGIALTWEKNTGSDGYQIYYDKEKNGEFVQLLKADKTKTSYTVKNLEEGTWYYKIRAYKAVDGKKYYGKFSDVKSVVYKTTDPSLSVPTVPTVPTQPEEDGEITMNITIGNTTFIATLENNDTAKALVNQLPLTINMSEHNGNEKYNYLSSSLRADTSSYPGTINEGDLMLYGENCLVLFYKTFHTSYCYVKLGHIDDSTGLTQAVGSGDVQITFSINE